MRGKVFGGIAEVRVGDHRDLLDVLVMIADETRRWVTNAPKPSQPGNLSTSRIRPLRSPCSSIWGRRPSQRGEVALLQYRLWGAGSAHRYRIEIEVDHDSIFPTDRPPSPAADEPVPARRPPG